MPLPATICLDCVVPPQALCLSFPGGGQLCVNLPNAIIPSSSEVARQFFAQVNAALAPLGPIFAVMDAIKATVACVTAVPEAITKLDVTGLLQCAPDMAEKLSKLLTLFPPLSIPVLVRDLISAMIVFLEGLRNDLEGAKRQADRILEAATASQQPGNSSLAAIVSCAQGFYDKVMEHMSSSAAPLNRLIGVINAFLSLIPGVQPIPCIGGLDGTPSVIQDALRAFITTLTIVRNLLPGGLKLNPYVPKGANC